MSTLGVANAAESTRDGTELFGIWYSAAVCRSCISWVDRRHHMQARCISAWMFIKMIDVWKCKRQRTDLVHVDSCLMKLFSGPFLCHHPANNLMVSSILAYELFILTYSSQQALCGAVLGRYG